MKKLVKPRNSREYLKLLVLFTLLLALVVMFINGTFRDNQIYDRELSQTKRPPEDMRAGFRDEATEFILDVSNTCGWVINERSRTDEQQTSLSTSIELSLGSGRTNIEGPERVERIKKGYEIDYVTHASEHNWCIYTSERENLYWAENPFEIWQD
jgi:intein-encoded DNA endonuclease-like protein